MNKAQLRQLVKENIEYLSSLDVGEYYLYHKWQQLNNLEYTDNDVDCINWVYRNIWVPKYDDDFINVKPYLLECDTRELENIWVIARHFISRGTYWGDCGKKLHYLVLDDKSDKLLGIIGLTGDYMSLSGRDKWLRWNNNIKLKGRRLHYIAGLSTCVATQPFSFLYNGGKLLALLASSDIVENRWNEKHTKETLVGVSTTGYFGSYSQYVGLAPYYKKLEASNGANIVEPSLDVYKHLIYWMKRYHPYAYERQCTQAKTRNIIAGCRLLDIHCPKNGHTKGIYFCSLYTNTRYFLQCKTNDPGKKRFRNDVDTLTDVWRERWALPRIINLQQSGRVIYDTLFLDIVGEDWEVVKERFKREKEY